MFMIIPLACNIYGCIVCVYYLNTDLIKVLMFRKVILIFSNEDCVTRVPMSM
jgi:hypothetical protein